MRTSIFRIELALDGKVDFVKKTSPWGGSDDGGASGDPPMTESGELDRDAVADQVAKAFGFLAKQ